MADVLFQCGECSKHMCVDGSRIGRRFHCPDCASLVVVPPPAIVFPCAGCRGTFAVADDLRETDFLCPNCEAVMHIPSCTVIACPQCAVNIELDDDLFAELEGESVDCPECGSAVPVPTRPDAGPGTAASGAKKLPKGFNNKTVRLDEIIDSIPQAQHVREGHCPYCNSDTEQRDSASYICRKCGRMIHIVKSKVRH
jgi:DNA-directed RNA polymerase subunit RPC12/RpoP